MSNEKTFLNLYWSFRRYLYANFMAIPAYYNPTTRPPVTAARFFVVKFQDDYMGAKMSFSYPRIFCVVKQDPEEIALAEFVSSVVEKFASQGSEKRLIDFYNQSTGLVIGQIWVEDVRTRPTLPYSDGYIQKAVDMTLRYGVEQRHL